MYRILLFLAFLLTFPIPGEASLSDGYYDLPGSYACDDNGNMTADPSKGITVTYNHLDLPTTVK